jgi:hypothetical protein
MSGKDGITDSGRRVVAEARNAPDCARSHDGSCGTRHGSGPPPREEAFNPFRFQIKTLPRGLRAQMLRFELPLIPPEELMERVPLAKRVRSRLLRGSAWLARLLWVRRIPAGIGIISLAVLGVALAIVFGTHRASSQGAPGDRERPAAAAPLPSPDGVLSAPSRGASAESAPAEPPTTPRVEPVAAATSAARSAPTEPRLTGVAPSRAWAGSTAPSASAAGVGSVPASGRRMRKFFIPD